MLLGRVDDVDIGHQALVMLLAVEFTVVCAAAIKILINPA